MFPAAGDTQFLDVLRTDRLTRVKTAAEELAAFLAIFARKLDQVAVRRLKAELAEIEVFVEGRVGRTEYALIFRGKIGNRQAEPGPDVDRVFLPFAFIGHEEVQHILDDRAAERPAELEILRLDLGARQFRRPVVAQALIGIVDEDLAVEIVRPRLGHRRDRDRTDLIEFGLIVGGKDAILAHRELRERVALRRILAGNAVLQNIVLLPDAIDEDVDRTAVLRPALQPRLAAGTRHELDARRKVGKGEEVAVVLGQHLDLALRDVRADLAAFHRADAAAGHDDRIPIGRGDVGLRKVEIEHRALAYRQGEFVGPAHAARRGEFETIGADGERRDIIAAAFAHRDVARQASVDVDRGDLRNAAVGLHRTAQRRAADLRLHRRRHPNGERGTGTAPCQRGSERTGARPARGNGLKIMRKLHGILPFWPPTFPAVASFTDRLASGAATSRGKSRRCFFSL